MANNLQNISKKSGKELREWRKSQDQPAISEDKVVKTKRINIDYSGKDKDRLWRFYIKDNPFVSRKWK